MSRAEYVLVLTVLLFGIAVAVAHSHGSCAYAHLSGQCLADPVPAECRCPDAGGGLGPRLLLR